MNWMKLFSRDWILTTGVALLGAALCVRLAIWQLDRLTQRRASNEHFRTIQVLPALELPTGEGLLCQEYRAVHARGSHDYEHQIAIRNQIYNGEYGYLS
jgi:surfeit locus 1 family protein